MNLHRHFTLPFVAFALAACGHGDELESRFKGVAIGDPRSQLLSTMQVPPSESKRLEIPFASWERATWVDSQGKRLEATLVVDRVVAKSIH